MLRPEEIARYGRHIILPGFGRQAQEKLQSARILIVGAGGLGVPMLQYLCAMGAGVLGIVDDDNVEESNLHRQVLYQRGDIGRKKVKAAHEHLPKLNPFVKLEIHPLRLTEQNAADLIGRYDIVADGSDNFHTKYLVNDVCVALGKPLVHGSALGFNGQLSVFNLAGTQGKRGPNYRDLFPDAPDNAPDCATGGVLGVVPGILGSLMALEVVKVATGVGQPLSGRVLNFDSLNHRFVTVELLPASLPAAQPAEPLLAEPATSTSSCPGPASIESPLALPDEEDEEIPMEPAVRRSVQHLSPTELEEWGEREIAFSLIDVREPSEHQLVNIGGRLIPFSKLENNLSRFRPDITYVMYCKTGARSLIAAEMLLAHGIQNVYTLDGGIIRYIHEVAPELQSY